MQVEDLAIGVGGSLRQVIRLCYFKGALCSRAPAWHMHKALGLFTAPQKRKQVEQGSVGTGCRHSTLAGQLQGWTITCQAITAGD